MIAPADAPTRPISAGGNTFAACPFSDNLAAYYEITVECAGDPDPRTGYLADISQIDQTVRDVAVPIIRKSLFSGRPTSPAQLLPQLVAAIQRAIPAPGEVGMVSWQLTPYHRISMARENAERVTLTQQFEFAAAHRLHSDALSAQENRRIFGKCNSPNAHGHNYRLHVEVASPLSGDQALQHSDIEQIVMERVIDRFDHKNLNLDTEEFRTVNPSVEHIAKACFDLLDEPMASRGGNLLRVTVWETEKTSCTYERPSQ